MAEKEWDNGKAIYISFISYGTMGIRECHWIWVIFLMLHAKQLLLDFGTSVDRGFKPQQNES